MTAQITLRQHERAELALEQEPARTGVVVHGVIAGYEAHSVGRPGEMARFAAPTAVHRAGATSLRRRRSPGTAQPSKPAPVTRAAAIDAATTTSTTAQNDGHQRVLST